jgi:hypothetical protein
MRSSDSGWSTMCATTSRNGRNIESTVRCDESVCTGKGATRAFGPGHEGRSRLDIARWVSLC